MAGKNPSRLRFPDLVADRVVLTACLTEATKALAEGDERARPFIAKFTNAIGRIEADLESRTESAWRRHELKLAGIS